MRTLGALGFHPLDELAHQPLRRVVDALHAEADGVLYLNSGAALNAATGKVITTIWGGMEIAAEASAAIDTTTDHPVG